MNNNNNNNGTRAPTQRTTAIQLTPPASLYFGTRNQSDATATKRTNGHATSSTTHQFQTQFTPDEPTTGGGVGGSLFDSTQFKSNGTSKSHNGFSSTFKQINGQPVRNGMNGLSGNTVNGHSNNNNSPKAISRQNGHSTASNKFTPDTDFVADFGTSAQNGAKAADNANADFADFEHNTIFNASGKRFRTVAHLFY